MREHERRHAWRPRRRPARGPKIFPAAWVKSVIRPSWSTVMMPSRADSKMAASTHRWPAAALPLLVSGPAGHRRPPRPRRAAGGHEGLDALARVLPTTRKRTPARGRPSTIPARRPTSPTTRLARLLRQLEAQVELRAHFEAEKGLHSIRARDVDRDRLHGIGAVSPRPDLEPPGIRRPSDGTLRISPAGVPEDRIHLARQHPVGAGQPQGFLFAHGGEREKTAIPSSGRRVLAHRRTKARAASWPPASTITRLGLKDRAASYPASTSGACTRSISRRQRIVRPSSAARSPGPMMRMRRGAGSGWTGAFEAVKPGTPRPIT